MKYYSEKLNKLFTSVEELNKAEAKRDEEVKKEKELKKQKETRLKEVQVAIDNARDLLDKYCKDYGYNSLTAMFDLFN